MDGRGSKTNERETPIEKPCAPLPVSVNPVRLSELPTKPRRETNDLRERAHFYRKHTDENGPPVYGFHITREPAEPLKKGI